MARRKKEDALKTRQQIIDAARLVFSQRGVSGTTLEHIAQAAGVTRGAIYWHFADKIDLFFAMRDQVTLPLFDQPEDQELGAGKNDPLACIEAFLTDRMTMLNNDPVIRETFEIMTFKCEYVGVFEGVPHQAYNCCTDVVEKLARNYQLAEEMGLLRDGIQPQIAAMETFLFLTGMIRLWLMDRNGEGVRPKIAELIHAHLQSKRR